MRKNIVLDYIFSFTILKIHKICSPHVWLNQCFILYLELPETGRDLSFEPLSSVDADPPVFSLSFNVTNRSPTIVTCSVSESLFDVSDDDVIRTVSMAEDPISVEVIVLVRMRVAGQYQCSVTTDKITKANDSSALTATRNITGKYLNFFCFRSRYFV